MAFSPPIQLYNNLVLDWGVVVSICVAVLAGLVAFVVQTRQGDEFGDAFGWCASIAYFGSMAAFIWPIVLAAVTLYGAFRGLYRLAQPRPLPAQDPIDVFAQKEVERLLEADTARWSPDREGSS